MRIYSSVHAAGKAHAGGARGGLFSASKSLKLPFAISAAAPPTASGISIDMMSFFQSGLFAVAFLLTWSFGSTHIIYNAAVKKIHRGVSDPCCEVQLNNGCNLYAALSFSYWHFLCPGDPSVGLTAASSPNRGAKRVQRNHRASPKPLPRSAAPFRVAKRRRGSE